MRGQQIKDERRALRELRERIAAGFEADRARIDACLGAIDMIGRQASFEEARA